MDNDQIEMIIRAILSRPEFIRAVAAELNKFEMFKSHGSHIAQALPRNCIGRRALAQIRPIGS